MFTATRIRFTLVLGLVLITLGLLPAFTAWASQTEVYVATLYFSNQYNSKSTNSNNGGSA